MKIFLKLYRRGKKFSRSFLGFYIGNEISSMDSSKTKNDIPAEESYFRLQVDSRPS